MKSSGRVSRLPSDHEIHIARNIKVVDWIKTQMLESLALLYKGLQQADDQMVLEGLAEGLVWHYLLSRRLGIPFHELETQIIERLHMYKNQGHHLEEWFQDFSILEEYMAKR